jgi:hypothetical protein
MILFVQLLALIACSISLGNGITRKHPYVIVCMIVCISINLYNILA